MALKEHTTQSGIQSVASGNFGIDRTAFRAAIVLALVALCAVAIWPLQAAALNQEGGLIETISAAALFTAGVVALVRYRGVQRLYIGFVLLLLAERELEAEVYAEDSLPFLLLNGLDQLLDMTLVRVVLAVVILGGFVWHGIPNAWRALKLRAPFLLVFFLAGFSAFVAQVLEEISSAFDQGMSEIMIARLFALEETLEMFFSIGILAAVLIGWPKTKTEETSNDQQPHSR